MPSQQFKNLLKMMPADFNIESDDFSTVRAKMKPFHGHPIAAGSEVRYSNDAGLKIAWLRAAQCDSSSRYALFCHGGGFVSCTAEDYLFYAEYVSRFLNCEVAVPDYRLAPEHPYPAALDDCFKAYQQMLAAGIEASSIVITGDSCGGGLAASTLLRARDEGLNMPACLLGLTGWFDLTLADVEETTARTEPLITPGWYLNRVKDYLFDADPKAPYASPAFADCTGLPPMLLQVGSNDLSKGGAARLASSAAALNIAAIVDEAPGMVHGFHGLVSSEVSEALEAWNRAREFVDGFIPSN